MADDELHQLYAAAIQEDAQRPSGERVGIINAVLAARDIHIEQLTVRLGQYADRADKLLAARGRIANAHSKDVGEGGLTSGYCNECDHRHPCPTYIWATTDRNPLATWDPDDDEPDTPSTTTKETTT